MKDQIIRKLLRRSYSVVSSANVPSESSETEINPQAGEFNGFGVKYKTSVTLGLTGLVIIATGMILMFAHPYKLIFDLKILFTDGGEVFELWRNPPVDLYLRVHLFNITNADEFLSGKEKLRVQEVGPYVYKEIMSHDNATFNDNGTISATPRHPLVWVPELSIGDHETDQLVLPHIALLSIAHVVSDESYFTRLGLNLLIRQTDSQPLVKMSPKEFMFGYESALMTIGNKFLSSWITFDKLGLIDRMYDFDGDFETVYTGEGDVRKGGLIDTYRGSEKIPQWDSPCGNVRGASDGAKFPSHIEPNDTLKFFRKSLCRAKPLVRVNTTMSSGLKGYVYRFADNANDNGRYDPQNKCFCKTEKCLPPGLLDVHECYYGFPIALSYPHFFQGDQILSDSVDGLEPDIRKHQSYFVIQPESGLPLDLAVRYQINMALGNIKSIANVEKFSNMIIPMLWTENRMYTLPEKMAARFQLYLNVGPLVENGIMHLFFVIGPLIILIGLYMFKKSKKTFQNQAPWIDEEMTTMEQKLSTYIPKSRKSMTAKELEVYFSSLVAPLNQHLDCHEIGFQEFSFKDED